MVPLQEVDDKRPDALRITDRGSMSEAGDLDVLRVWNGPRNLAGSGGTGVDVELEADDQARDSHVRQEGQSVVVGGDEGRRTSPSFGGGDASPVRLDRLHALDEGVVRQSVRGEGGQQRYCESKRVHVVVGGQSLPRLLKNPVEFVLTPISGKQSRASDPLSRHEGGLLGDGCALRPADEGDGFAATGDECVNATYGTAPVQLLRAVFERRDLVAEGKQIRADVGGP